MRDAFDSQLRTLMERIMLMGGLAEGMIGLAMGGLLEHDESAAGQVRAKELEVDALQVEIDERVVELFIHQQPVARDARTVVTASRVAVDVERIADQAVNVTANTAFVLQSPAGEPPPELLRMADAAQQMVASSLAALVTRDVSLADQVFEDEKAVDALRDQVFRILLNRMITDPLTAQQSMSLVLISRNLERIGDHATNIAEEVIYLVRGRDVRHQSDRLATKIHS